MGWYEDEMARLERMRQEAEDFERSDRRRVTGFMIFFILLCIAGVILVAR